MKEYKLKCLKGIDDLKSLYAFVGNSQGDETRTNSIEDYKNSEGWLSYQFNVPLTEQDIFKEIEIRNAWNIEYINKLKKTNEYGEEYFISLLMQDNPDFDIVSPMLQNNYPLSSYSFQTIDL